MARRPSGAATCELYCRARLATVSCPSCFGLLFEGAAFCQHCGTARDSAQTREANRSKCAACKGQMSWVHAGDADLLECETCEGTWLEAATFERICADRESQAAVLHQSRQLQELIRRVGREPDRSRYTPAADPVQSPASNAAS